MNDNPMNSLVEQILHVLLRLEDLAAQSITPVLDDKEEWLDAVDMLQKFHVSRTTLYRLKKEGHLVPIKLGKKEFYLLSDVQRTLKERGNL